MRFASVAELRDQLSGYLIRSLEKWKFAHLRFPSTVRVSNIGAIEKSLIRRVLGRLVPADLKALDATLREALSLA